MSQSRSLFLAYCDQCESLAEEYLAARNAELHAKANDLYTAYTVTSKKRDDAFAKILRREAR